MEESGEGVCSGQLAIPDGSALAAGDMDGEVVVLEVVRKWWSHGALWIFGFLVGVYFASDCGGELSWNPVAYWRSIQFASRSPWAWTTPEVYESVVAAKKEICGAALVAIGTSAAYAVGGLPTARVALAFTTARTGSRAGRKLVEAADRLRDRGAIVDPVHTALSGEPAQGRRRRHKRAKALVAPVQVEEADEEENPTYSNSTQGASHSGELAIQLLK